MTAVVPAAAEAPAAATSLLIHYHVTSLEVLTGVEATSDSLIFRDGLVIERLEDSLGRCSVVRSRALPQALRDLNAVLARNRVGLQQGNCSSEPDGDYRVERRLTWFGKGSRQHSYTIGTLLGELCPLATREIDQAVTAVLGTATERQVATACLGE
jgi:hypothetical protein